MDKLDSFTNRHLAPKRPISDELASILATKIFKGDYEDNYMFPNEIDQCKLFGIGRNSLREAYKILEQNGFITRTKRGTFVNDHETILRSMPITLALRLSDDKDRREHRLVIECGIVEFAAQRATAENIANMRHYIDQMIQNVQDVQIKMQYDFLFHYEIARAAQNDLFLTSMASIEEFMMDQYRLQNNRQLIINNIDNTVHHHLAVLKGIEARNPEQARSAMHDHLSDYSIYFSDLSSAKAQNKDIHAEDSPSVL